MRSGIGIVGLACAAALVGCGGSSSGGAASASHSIVTTGGAGAAGDGGAGGAVAILGLDGEDVSVLRGGATDTSFTLPTERPSLGDNPLVISASTRLTVDENGHVSGTAVPTATATGLHILGGATLTLDFTGDGDALDFERGAIIEGTLSIGARELALEVRGLLVGASGEIVAEGPPEGTEREEGASGGLVEIESSGTVVVGGRILARGRDAASGGSGGGIHIGVGPVANLYCTGTLDASGGAGREARGGDGGEIRLLGGASSNSFAGVFISGALRASGGEGAERGGDGGSIDIEAGDPSGFPGAYGSVVAGGALDASGGRGRGVSSDDPERSGGDAGRVVVVVGLGEARVGGTIAARGGDGAPAPDVRGGDGGFVLIARGSERSGLLDVGADIDTRGGAGGRGGRGGPVQIGRVVEEVGDGELVLAASSLEFPPAPVVGRALVLRGYARFEVSGGAGAGGRGGDAAAARGSKEAELIDIEGVLDAPGVGVKSIATESGGQLRFEADIVGLGGDSREVLGLGGRAGRGAEVMLMLEDRRRLVEAGSIAGLVSSGAIDAGGGDGVRGGRAGVVAIVNTTLTEKGGEVGNLSALRAVTVLGRISATGGAGQPGTSLVGAGGAGGFAFLVSLPSGAATALADIDVSGGACPGARGGDGGAAALSGGATALRANITSAGGNGAIGGSGGRGVRADDIAELLTLNFPSTYDLDDPGDIEDGTDDQSRVLGGIVLHAYDAPTDALGRLSAAGGRGTSLDGAAGAIIVDGVFAETNAGVEVLP